MKRTLQSILFLVLFTFVNTLFAQDLQQFFDAGNAHYSEGRYQAAIDEYQKIINNDVESAELYYNMANAHYKLNNVAPSNYYYEKAKQLAPSDSDIKNNASFAQKMKIDAITPLPENTFDKTFNNIISLLTIDNWAIVSVILVFFFVILFLAYYFSGNSRSKRLYFLGSMLSIFLAIVSIVFAYDAFAKAKKDHYAIVFAPESHVKSEPNLASTDAFLLHEGTKVLILENVKDWQHIQLVDGKDGWIPTTDIQEL